MKARSSGGRPTKAESAARTEELLDAARKAFSRKGFAGTSLDEISMMLRSSKHTIYRRYSGKLALLQAVVERDIDSFTKALAGAVVGVDDPDDALRAMSHTYFRFGASREYAALYAAISLEAATSADLRANLQQWAIAAVAPLRTAIARAMPKVDPIETSEILIDLLDGAANRVRWSDETYAKPELLDQSFTARWKLFRRAVAESV